MRGEATKNIPIPIKVCYPEIPWKDMAGMRDKVIRAHFEVDLKRVWSTVNSDIPVMKPFFEKLLKENEHLKFIIHC